MGKTTVAAMFQVLGWRVWDADAAVARLYAVGGAAVEPISAIAPDAVVHGAIDKAQLKAHLAAHPSDFASIEAAVHPLVRADREAAAEAAARDGAAAMLFDIPLLFETGAEGEFDAVVVVSAPADVQRRRALSRPGMTESHLDAILRRQTPDAEKRRRADHVIDTGASLDETRAAVATVAAAIEDRTEGRM